MERQSAKITASEAPSVACQAEFNFLKCRDSSHLFIHRMNPLRIRKGIHIIHFLLCQRQCRRILDNIAFGSIGFCHWSGTERVCILILYGKTVRIGFLVFFYFLIGRKNDRIINSGQIFAFKNSSGDISQFLHRKPAVESFCNLQNGVLSHSIRDHIRSGIQQNTVFDFIIPVIVVSQTSEARLDPAQNNRRFLIGLTDQVAVDDHGTVRTQTHLSTRRIGILLSVFL